MTRYRADWVLPITAPPVRNGWVAVESGRIVEVGAGPADAVDLGAVALLPGLVNAHTHLELSYLRGQVPRSRTFGPWVRAVLASRRQHQDPAEPTIVDAARGGIAEARAAGTALVGDVANTLLTVPLLRESALAAQVFHELTGFTEPDPDARVRDARQAIAALGKSSRDVRISIAPHAPYSVSAALFDAIRRDIDAHSPAVSSVHLGETAEEVALLRNGTGEMRALLEELGRWPSDWVPPETTPVAYLSDLGFLDSRVLVVHGVQFDGDDLTRLRSLGVTLVSCPRSNGHVGAGAPPIEAFYAMDVEVALGTDSLASVETLSLFDELAEARRLAPRVAAASLLRSATLVGARALGFGDDFGSLDVGRRAEILAVRVPADIVDVEEYLVGGVKPGDVAWIE